MSLRQKEAAIRKAAKRMDECGLEIGQVLIDIERDDDWKETEYSSFDEYLQAEAENLAGRPYSSCRQLMALVATRSRIEDVGGETLNVQSLSETHLVVLSGLAPTSKGKGNGKDYAKIPAKDIKKALKRAEEIRGERPTSKPKTSDVPTVRDVREAVREVKTAKEGVTPEQDRQRDAETSVAARRADYRLRLAKGRSELAKLRRLISESNVALVKSAETRRVIAECQVIWDELIEQASVYHPSLLEEEV